MSDPKEGKPDLETCFPLPSNEPQSADCGKTSGNPGVKELPHDGKSGHRGKAIRILKVVLKRSDESPRMRSFQCKECGDSLEDKSVYMKHLKIHKTERLTRCTVCGENFSRKSSLVLHQQIHAKEKSFTCDECGKTFCQRSSLVIHSKIHTYKKANGNKNSGGVKKHLGEKPYRCLECKKMFVLHKNFLKHQKVHVRDVPPNPKPASPSLEEKSDAEAQPVANLGLMLEEMRKMRENIDMLLLNQQSQLQVLQGIQKQLSIILLGNDLLNSNVYSLGLLLGQQAPVLGMSSSPLLLNPSNLLSENARPFSSHVSSQPSLSEIVLSCLRSDARCPAL